MPETHRPVALSRVAWIRWGLLGFGLALGLVLGLTSADSGRFAFGAGLLGGLAAQWLFDWIGERLLFGEKLANELKEARSILREARRLLKRAGPAVPGEVRARIDAACAGLRDALGAIDRPAMARHLRELTNLAEAHLFVYRKAAWREYFEPIAVAAAIALLLRGFVFEAFEIPSGSMIPSLYVGDKIFVNKLAYGLRVPLLGWRLADWRLPARGEVAVFIYPLDPGENFVKRVIALPGDTVAVREGFLYVNGQPVSRRYLGQRSLWDKTRQDTWFESIYQVYEERQGELAYSVMSDPLKLRFDFPPTRVPPDQLFVMGDNRDNSSDSREWGFVPTRNLVGRAMFIWWSWGPSLNTERYFHWVQ